MIIAFLYFGLGDQLGGHLFYWSVRAFPPCRLPVFVMGCLAGEYCVRKQTRADSNTEPHTDTHIICLHPVTWLMGSDVDTSKC